MQFVQNCWSVNLTLTTQMFFPLIISGIFPSFGKLAPVVPSLPGNDVPPGKEPGLLLQLERQGIDLDGKNGSTGDCYWVGE